MAAPGDNFGEQEMTGMLGNSHPQQKLECDDDSGVVAGEKKWRGWPGDTVFRILVPIHKVGAIIGRKGEFIKRMCEESRARIKVLDGPQGIQERAVMISAKEEPDLSIPPAIDGLLRVHKRIVDGLDNDSRAPNPGATASTRLLVHATHAASLIGKQGATIKSIQESSNSIVRVRGTEDLPVFALQDDRVVEIQGEPTGVHKAVELIASHLRKFLVDHSVLPLFEMHGSMPNSQMNPNMPPPPQSWGHPQGPPPNARASGFGNDSQFMPPWQHEGYYPPSDFPPLDKQPHHGLSVFGGNTSMGFHSPANAPPPPPPIITQVTQHMQIPLSYADAVIGTGGANISYIRRASGATITIQETRGVSGEMTVEINGTSTQVQTAQQMIQNFMAEAQGPIQNPTSSMDQGYSSFQTHGSTMYGSPQSNAGPAAHGDGGGYGSVYGNNYGY